MNTVYRMIVVMGMLAALAGQVQAANRYVSPTGGNSSPYTNWATAATSIQTAITAASVGETVWVTNATYTLSSTITLSKNITVAAFDPAAKPVVNGNHAVSCISISSSGAVLDGFVVSNGYSASGIGVGIYMTAGTVQNCNIVSNYGANSGNVYGGGIGLTGGLVTNCTIRNNYNRSGGGVGVAGAGARVVGCTIDGNTAALLGGGATFEGAGLIENCVFTNNNPAGVGGGGTGANCAGAVVRNSQFVGNSGGSGGGVSVPAGMVVSNCVIEGNTATGEGGGVEINGLVVNCTIRNNRSTGSSGGGGVMGRAVTQAILRNCLVYSNVDNSANAWGGICCVGSGTLVVESSTVADNSGAGLGYGFGGSLVATNCIVYFHSINPPAAAMKYSCAPGLSGSGNITADPKFVNRAAWDYTLQGSSPCLNVGTNLAWMTGAMDLAGKARISGASVDMGAYEFTPKGTVLEIY